MAKVNKDLIKGKWTEVKGKAKQKWGRLTDDDFMEMKGTYEELQGKIQKKYGYEEEEAKRNLDNFLHENHWDRE